jgi:uroporphyrinogen decarboxylase
MTPRERIIAALEHRESDRLPTDFGGTDCSSIHLTAYDKLRKLIGIEPRSIRLACLSQMVVDVDDEVQNYFGGDAKALYFQPRRWKHWQSAWGIDVETPELWTPERLSNGTWVIRNAKGVVVNECPPSGKYFDPVGFLLGNVESPEEIENYADVFERWDWPTACDESVEEYAARAKQLYQSTDKAVVASWRMHYLQSGQIMRGYEQFMVDLLTDEPMTRGILDRLHAVYMARAEKFLSQMADYADVIFLTDDLGTQNAALISPTCYREMIKPYWAELIGLIKKYDKKVLMHSCGAISELIPDLIEMGVDAVNPVQITATGMSPARLKKEFGRDIAFWGGGVNTQGILDKGTVQEVRDDVKRNVDIFAKGGGFVFTQVHNIQSDVPPENIVAAYKAALDA